MLLINVVKQILIYITVGYSLCFILIVIEFIHHSPFKIKSHESLALADMIMHSNETPMKTATSANASLRNLSQTHPSLSFLPNGLVMAFSINTGLFVAANINVNFTFDPDKNELVVGSVSTATASGFAIGAWTQNFVTDIFTKGNSLFFTVNATITTTIPGTFFNEAIS